MLAIEPAYAFQAAVAGVAEQRLSGLVKRSYSLEPIDSRRVL